MWFIHFVSWFHNERAEYRNIFSNDGALPSKFLSEDFSRNLSMFITFLSVEVTKTCLDNLEVARCICFEELV